jgi:hypothetical protein
MSALAELKVEIRSAHQELGVSGIASTAKVGVYWVFQIICYVLFAFLAYSVLSFPSALGLSAEVAEGTRLNANLSNDEVSAVITLIKVSGVFVSSGFLLAGILIGRLRKKHLRYMRAIGVIHRANELLTNIQ